MPAFRDKLILFYFYHESFFTAVNLLAPLLLPLLSTGFLLTGPHLWWQAPLWVLPMGLPVAADYFQLGTHQPPGSLPEGAATAVVGGIATLFIADIWILLEMSRHWSWQPGGGLLNTLGDLFAVKFLLGSHGAHSSLLVGHELIHRRSRLARGLGRFVLTLCCYEHFATEHIRGHHRRVGREQDPATARYGETYRQFWRRTVPGQFKSAWQLENHRLRTARPGIRTLLRHRVFQGVLAELVLVSGIGWYFGPTPLLAFMIQTVMAIRNLEAINYIQHWGLIRGNRGPGPGDAWHSDTWCSSHLLLGLSHHAHHHCEPTLPHHRLSSLNGSPKLPYGYFALMFLITYRNQTFQKLAKQELRRLGLGPYAHPGVSEAKSDQTAAVIN